MEILVVKPEEINDYIKAETIGISAPRDFVSKVQEYLQSIGRRGTPCYRIKKYRQDYRHITGDKGYRYSLYMSCL